MTVGTCEQGDAEMTAIQITSRRRDIARELDQAAASIHAAQQALDGMHAAIDAMPELRDNQYWMDAYRKATELRDEMVEDQTHWMERAIDMGFGPEDF